MKTILDFLAYFIVCSSVLVILYLTIVYLYEVLFTEKGNDPKCYHSKTIGEYNYGNYNKPKNKKMNSNQDIAIKHLGMLADLISMSKSGYKKDNPDNIVVFNSNICTNVEKIWHGDIDITKSLQKLKDLAIEIKEDIYVLYEMDGRFNNEDKPLLHKYVVHISANGEVKYSDNITNKKQ